LKVGKKMSPRSLFVRSIIDEVKKVATMETRQLLGARLSDTSDTERFAAMEDDNEVRNHSYT
jgi:hypothetical protein